MLLPRNNSRSGVLSGRDSLSSCYSLEVGTDMAPDRGNVAQFALAQAQRFARHIDRAVVENPIGRERLQNRASLRTAAAPEFRHHYLGSPEAPWERWGAASQQALVGPR